MKVTYLRASIPVTRPDLKQTRDNFTGYDLSLHPYGVLVSAADQPTRLIPWHLLEDSLVVENSAPEVCPAETVPPSPPRDSEGTTGTGGGPRKPQGRKPTK